MTIHNATVILECDKCHKEETIELQYVYHNYSGTSGQYDDKESSIIDEANNNLFGDEPWQIDDENEGQHICGCCANEDEDE